MMGRARGKLFASLLVGCLCALAAAPARAFDDATADRALQFARQQLNRSATNPAIATNRYPKASTDGTWTLVANSNMIDWVQGFFPGQLWLMYDDTGRDPFWRTKADAWTRNLELQKTNTQTHDLGFKFMPSFGQAYRLTGNTYYRSVLLTAAGSLATRFNSTVGVIDCCDWNSRWVVPMVTDTMVDLELLFWASQQTGGNPAWKDMALRHALKTAADMVRADGGTWHVVDYSTTGTIRSKGTYQGYNSTSTWARGQAWAIYGFTMAYRYTGDARMLATAQKVTDYYLARLPADSVPNWDFNAPSQQKDSSAAAIVASALLELSTFVTDPTVAQRYRNAALAMLDSLSSPAYLAAGTTSPGILLHGVAFYRTPINPEGDDIDKSLIYGDYYFVEALMRYKLQAAGGWYSTLDFRRSLHDLGPGNTGVRIIEFDVTPLSKVIDTVVGYADTSTNVTSYAGLALTVRLNPSGFFDARRGGEYAATNSVPYNANATYHVRIRADMNAKTYSVWVTPPGGTEVLLADRFAFRSGIPATDDVGKVALKSGHFDNEIRVRNHTLRAEGAPVPVEWLSTLSWSGSVHELGPGNTGVRVTEFDVTPLAKPIDGVIGYADTSTLVSAYSSLAVLIRMNQNGFFDVRRGGEYTALANVPYNANATYHVRTRVDLLAKTYSVWVTPPGGAEVLVADRFAFRADAPPTDDLGKVAVKSGLSETEFRVRGHTVRAEGAIALPGEPVVPEEPVEALPPDDERRVGDDEEDDAESAGCASAPGTAMAAVGLLLWLLRRPRVSRRR